MLPPLGYFPTQLSPALTGGAFLLAGILKPGHLRDGAVRAVQLQGIEVVAPSPAYRAAGTAEAEGNGSGGGAWAHAEIYDGVIGIGSGFT